MWANVEGRDDASNYLPILYNGLVCVFTEAESLFLCMFTKNLESAQSGTFILASMRL